MKEIYLLNKGDSINKINYECNISKKLEKSPNKVFNYDYVVLEEGNDDIVVVKNYLPVFEYRLQKNENILDLLARGFEVSNINEIRENDLVILSKPKSIKYVVKPLEKLDNIANKFGLTIEYIMETNKLVSDKLFVGQILWL